MKIVPVAIVALLLAGCSAAELSDFSTTHPSSKVVATTQRIENAQEKIDKVVVQVQPVVETAKSLTDVATSLGVPGAATVGTVLTIIGWALGQWNGRRKGDALHAQTIEGVAEAMPKLPTEAQAVLKSALSAAQDAATKKFVAVVKA